jgi:hypothetical protein
MKIENGYASTDICSKCLEKMKKKCTHWYADCETKLIDNVERTTCNFCNHIVEEKPIKNKKYRWYDVPFPDYC